VILVDTSIWIEVLRARQPLDLEDVLDFDDVLT
jgi:predicted nucleic acid-binding protein